LIRDSTDQLGGEIRSAREAAPVCIRIPGARGVLGSVPMVIGGLILATMAHVQGAGL
jgi:hypothetical protein